MGPKFHLWNLHVNGAWLSGEAWMWIGLKFNQWNLMGLLFDPWIPSNESWCCNVGIQELRSDGAQFSKVHHSTLKCKRIIQTLPFEFYFICVHCIFNIELMSCPCLCFKNWNLSCVCDFITLKFVFDFVILEPICDFVTFCANFWTLIKLESIDPHL